MLATVAAVLCLLLMLAGASLGNPGATAFSQPSPSGSGTEPTINLLNPAPGYDPQLGMPPRQEGVADPPKISDRPDGFDSAYHIVAWASGAPPGSVAEAYYQRGSSTEQTIGQMLLVPGTPDTFDTFWDIPTSLGDGAINIRVRLFKPTPTGFEEIANDQVTADLQNSDQVVAGTNPQTNPQDETVEITYPSEGAPLGFFKAKGGPWQAAIEGSTSNGTSEISVHYSTSEPGTEPEFTKCGNDNVFNRPESTISLTAPAADAPPIPFTANCALGDTDKPSEVTAIAAVTEEGDKADRSDVTGSGPEGSDGELSQDSADVDRVVRTYLQDPAEMKVDIRTDGNTFQTAQGRRVTGGCMGMIVTVTDALDRPVQGANLDIHITGPSDGTQFAARTAEFGDGPNSSDAKDPDKAHPTEGGAACTSDDSSIGPQGDHNRPGADDTKHIESSEGGGTGMSAANTGYLLEAGEWRFYHIGRAAGFADIQAWVDSPAVTEDKAPEADDDLVSQGEPRGEYVAQWLPAAIRLSIEPTAQTHAVGSCARFIVRVRGGTAPVPRANVDVHARGPSDNLDFCDPPDATPNRAPDGIDADHEGEDPAEATHESDPPRTQHTEGETDSEGNFVFGLVSPDTGDTTITAWYDGDTDQDDDVFDAEPSVSSTEAWSDAAGAPRVSFVNPTAYGPSVNPPNNQTPPANGTSISNKEDVDTAFHIVTRVDSLNPIEGVEILIGSTAAGPFTNLGQATRIGTTDTYELESSVNVTDGTYVLRAHILGTNVTKDQSVAVNRTTGPTDQPGSQQAETLEITAPENGTRAPFRGRTLTVRGVASSGTEGVDLFYTKVGPSVTPVSADWIVCGFVQLDGLGSEPQDFSADCTIAAGDQAGQVTGIAALTYDCTEDGCDAAPFQLNPNVPPTRNPGNKDSGDAHRVIGVESIPFFNIEPPETIGARDQCQKFTVIVEDQNGEGLRDENIDLHLEGPGSSASFCAPPDGSGSPRSAPNAGGHAIDPADSTTGTHEGGATEVLHTEGKTAPNGRFVFGIMSDTLGDSRISGWLDRNDDDVVDAGESTDTSIMHWEEDPGPSGCDIEGTDDPDTLVGTAASERICGFGGNDTIRGGGGNDVILGAAGGDRLRGGPGNDTIRGTGGRDNVFGGGGRDRLFGGASNDTVKGHRGNDTLRGNRGRDLVLGGPGRDSCRGGGGRDRLRGCETSGRTTRGFAARRQLI